MYVCLGFPRSLYVLSNFMVFFDFKPNLAASFLQTVQIRGLNIVFVFAITSAAGVSALVALVLIDDVVAVAAVVVDDAVVVVAIVVAAAAVVVDAVLVDEVVVDPAVVVDAAVVVGVAADVVSAVVDDVTGISSDSLFEISSVSSCGYNLRFDVL